MYSTYAYQQIQLNTSTNMNANLTLFSHFERTAPKLGRYVTTTQCILKCSTVLYDEQNHQHRNNRTYPVHVLHGQTDNNE